MNFNKANILICFALLSAITTESAKAEDGLQLINQTEAIMRSISFSAKCDWKGGLTTVIVQQKAEPDQYNKFRKEVIVKIQGAIYTNEFIFTKGGWWEILPTTKKAIRIDCLKIKSSVFSGLLENGLDTSIEADYSTEIEKINNREMFVVTQLPHLAKILSRKDSQQVETKILIGRDDHILYGYISKCRDGTVNSMRVTEFKILKEVAEDLFTLPIGFRENICTNIAEHARDVLEEVKARAQSPSFQKMHKLLEKRYRKNHYTMIVIVFLPTMFFVGFLLRDRFKNISQKTKKI